MIRMLHLRVVAGTGGGPEKTILNSPRYIREHGFDAEVVYLCPPDDAVVDSLKRRAKQSECPLTVLPDRGPADWRVLAEILKLCKSRNIQLLQTHDYKTNAIGLAIRALHRCSLVTMLHGWTDMTGRMPFYKKIDQWCIPRYRASICVSEDLRDECRRLRIPESKIHLVHNGIEEDRYQRTMPIEAAKAAIGARQGRYLIGCVSRLSPEKGLLDLIRVVQQLQAQGLPIDLWLAGDGPQRAELEQEILRLGLEDSVRLLGLLTDPIPFYQALDLFVLNSIREGLPNVLLEAMALETPVLSTRIAGIPSLLGNGDCGILIDPDSPDQLSDGIAVAFQSRGKTEQLAKFARKRIEEQYSFRARMKKVAAIYRSILTK